MIDDGLISQITVWGDHFKESRRGCYMHMGVGYAWRFVLPLPLIYKPVFLPWRGLLINTAIKTSAFFPFPHTLHRQQ